MLARAAIPRELAGRPVEIWFQDEPSIRHSKALRALEPLAHSARVGKPRHADPHLGGAGQRFRRAERDGRPAEGKRGTRPRIRRDRRFTWAYLFGAVCPERGTGAALVMPTVSVEAMSQHLAEISQCVSLGAIALVLLDGAGWHASPRLVVPDNIVLLPLPPHAPELNSTENIWEYLRSNWLSHCVWETYEAILEACCNAWNALMAKSEIITSIGTREWAQVKI